MADPFPFALQAVLRKQRLELLHLELLLRPVDPDAPQAQGMGGQQHVPHGQAAVVALGLAGLAVAFFPGVPHGHPLHLVCALGLSVFHESALDAAYIVIVGGLIGSDGVGGGGIHLVGDAIDGSGSTRPLVIGLLAGGELGIFIAVDGIFVSSIQRHGLQHVALIEVVGTELAFHVPRHLQAVADADALHLIVGDGVVDDIAQG